MAEQLARAGVLRKEPPRLMCCPGVIGQTAIDRRSGVWEGLRQVHWGPREECPRRPLH